MLWPLRRLIGQAANGRLMKIRISGVYLQKLKALKNKRENDFGKFCLPFLGCDPHIKLYNAISGGQD